jgi:hypothetical protein
MRDHQVLNLKMEIVSGSSYCGCCCYDNLTIENFGVGLEVGD